MYTNISFKAALLCILKRYELLRFINRKIFSIDIINVCTLSLLFVAYT